MADVLPSASGAVATAGKQPVPVILDLNRNGRPDYTEKDVRRAAANFIYFLVGLIFPKAPQTQAAQQVKAAVDAIIEAMPE